MASGGSYIVEGNKRVLKERSGHNLNPKLEQPAPAATAKKVKADEDKKESVTGRG